MEQIWEKKPPLEFLSSPLTFEDLSASSLADVPEDELVSRAIAQDQTAFRGLYDKYYDKVFRDIYYRVERRQDAEDISQHVFLQAWRAIGRYEPTGVPFIAWLLTIARNAVISHYRRDRKEFSVESDIVDLPLDMGIEDDVEIHLEHDRVRGLLRHLRPEHQMILTMRFLEDFDYKKIAVATGKTEANIRVIQHRALVALRNLIKMEEKDR